jgi:nucleoside phosphorylase
MSEFVVVVPKQDELFAVEWAFGTTLKRPDVIMGSGVELYRRQFPMGTITFALLDRQTNTYSSILTGEVIKSETPRIAFLVGTALGNPSKVPLGSIVVSNGVIDISERRYTDEGQSVYRTRETQRADELTHDARDFISRRFGQAAVHACIRGMTRRPTPLLSGASKALNEFVSTHRPSVFCEVIVSGNDYRMSRLEGLANDLWHQVPVAYAYDMEAAGFALAAYVNYVPWLVVRGISDHGNPASKSDLHRQVAAGTASRFLAEFIEGGLERSADVSPSAEPSTTIALLRDEAYRLDGSWRGVMAYLDDVGEPVIFEDRAEFTQNGSTVHGKVQSTKLQGDFRHPQLEYRMSFSIAKHGYAGGIWADTTATRRYFGVMLGQLGNDSTVLQGAWLGTHKEGIRKGLFVWHNTARDNTVHEYSLNSLRIGWGLIAQLRQETLPEPHVNAPTVKDPTVTDISEETNSNEQ